MFHLFDSLRDARGPDFNWQDYHYHYALGSSYGFPTCCIEQWCVESAYGVHNQAQQRGVVQNDGNPYVPCDKCAVKHNVKGWAC